MLITKRMAVTPKVTQGSIARDETAQKGPIILEIAPMARINPI